MKPVLHLALFMPTKFSVDVQLVHKLENWFVHNRRDLPWRHNKTPYRVWLSEIMLQQTQVSVVTDYFLRFVKQFPDIKDLAAADQDDVLALWSGLGYYSRGRNLHQTAKIIVDQYDGVFPDSFDEIIKLPGVGAYTAGAILALAFDKPAPVVDGNIARVLSRLFDDATTIDSPSGKKHFEALSASMVASAKSPAVFQEGMIELGALLCKKQNPVCHECPFTDACLAKRNNTIADLPKKTAKQARSDLPVVCAVIHTADAVWLEKRRSSGLFGGLYEPPNQAVGDLSDTRNVALQLTNERLGNALFQLTEHPVIIERTLTHRNLKLIGYSAHVKQKTKGAHWIKQHQLKNVGLSRAIEILLAKTAFSTEPTLF